jgi:hypothetical protein
MAKLRLTQPSFEAYSGQMGLLDFVDGLSTTDVDSKKAIRMAAVMLCEWEDGGNPGVTQSLLDNTNTSAPVFNGKQDGSDHDVAAKRVIAEPADSSLQIASEVKPVATGERLTREQIEDLADKGGIKSLREIADPKGIKGNSIKELIEAILKAG